MANTKTQAKKTKIRSKFSMPHALTVLLIVVFFAVFLTWVIPASAQVTTIDNNNAPISDFLNTGILAYGILDTFSAVGKGFVNAGDLIFFLLMFGAFMQIIIKSGAMEAGVGSLVKKMNGKEIFLIPILMFLFSIGGTVYGMGEETPPFYIILVPVLILAGFDAMTGTLTVLIGAAVGVMGSTINPFMIGAATSAIGADLISSGDGMGFRFLAWIILTIIAISFVTYYAWKVKKDSTKSVLSSSEIKDHTEWAEATYKLDDLPEFTKRRKVLMTIMGLSILLMVVFIMPWGSLLGVEGGIPGSESWAPWLSRLIPGLGEWYFIELGFLFLFLGIVSGIIAGFNEKEMINEFMVGAKDMVGVSLVIAIARGVSIVLGGGTTEASIELAEGTYNLQGDGSGAIINNVILVNSSANTWLDLLNTNINAYDSSFVLTEIFQLNNGIYESIGTGFAVDASTLSVAEAYLSEIAAANEADLVFSIDKDAIRLLSLSLNSSESISNTLLNGMASGLNNVDPIGIGPIIMLIQTPMAFLIPSTSGLSGVSMPIFAPVADIIAGGGPAGVNAMAHTINGTSFALGIVNMVTPSSGILMVGLSLGRVSYDKYLKVIWPLILCLYIVALLLLLIPSF